MTIHRARAWVGAASAAAATLLLALSVPCTGRAEAPIPVDVISVAFQESFEVTEGYAGRVLARRSSELGFEAGGRIDEILVDEGDPVEQGQVLVRRDRRVLRAQRAELDARREAMHARLELAKRTLQRRSKLRDADHLSRQAFDEATFDERALRAELAAAEAALERVDVDLDLSELRAPFAGTVIARNADEGTVLSPGQSVLRVIESQSLEVRLGVPLEAASSFHAGRSMAVEIGGRRVDGRVRRVLPTVDRETRTVDAILTLEAPSAVGALVADGALARVLQGRRVQQRGAWLPLDALAEGRRGLWSVYVVRAVAASGEPSEGGWRVDRRQVDVVHTEDDRVFVRGALREGEQVVARGVHRLVPGLQVRVLETRKSVSR